MAEKEYLQTHPWLTFSLNLRELPWSFWLDLGECIGKFDHLRRTAMSNELRDELHRLYLAKGAAATTAIEGNTLGEEGVRRRLENGEILPEASEYLGTEVDNAVALFNEFSRQAQENVLSPVTPMLLHKINAGVLRGLAADAAAGQVRQRGVTVANYRGAAYQECVYLLEKLCKWLQEGAEFREVERVRGRAAAAVLQAALAHLYIAWIHPYDDGNGRTARMAEFFLLLRGGVPVPAAFLMSNHCNKLRDAYYRELADSSRNRSPAAFLCFIAQGLRDGLREQLQWVYQEHEMLVWREYAQQNIKGLAKTRERKLALAIFLAGQKNALSEKQLLAADAVARWYGGKTPRMQTLQSDLASLKASGVAVREENGYRARWEVLREFMPPATGG